MIPKIIHYCWFGGSPLPPLAMKCIESWKKYLPDYEIKEWNETNFDVNIIPYTKEAYSVKKYAFVSDYARFWILNKYGGIYFDTDVEVVSSMDDILNKGAYMGMERNYLGYVKALINPGVGFALPPQHVFLLRIMQVYEKLHFILPNGNYNTEKTIVYYTTKLLQEFGLKNNNDIQLIEGIYVYPSDYFSPIDFITKRLHLTCNTHTIHQYMGSWLQSTSPWKCKIRDLLPEFLLLIYNKIVISIMHKSNCPIDNE